MPVKRILTISRHEKILRTPSEPVKKIDKSVRNLIQDIKDTMLDPNIPAVGLAAPQIGVMKRVFGIRPDYDGEQTDEEMSAPIVLINPEVLSSSEEEARDFDACLSIPGMMGFTNRKVNVRVRYRDEDWHLVERDFTGWDSRAFQHELDHLNGILFLDRLSTLDDLMVYVKGEDGKTRTVPYPKLIAQATQESAEKLNAPPPTLPSLKKV